MTPAEDFLRQVMERSLEIASKVAHGGSMTTREEIEAKIHDAEAYAKSDRRLSPDDFLRCTAALRRAVEGLVNECFCNDDDFGKILDCDACLSLQSILKILRGEK